MNNNWIKGIGVWLVVGIVLMMVFMQLTGRSAPKDVMDYSTMMSEAKSGNIVSYKEEGPKVAKVVSRDNKSYVVYLPPSIYTIDDLLKKVQLPSKRKKP